MTLPKWITDNKEDFLDFAKEHTVKEISNRYGKSYEIVYGFLYKFNIPHKNSRYNGAESEKNEMIALLAKHFSYSSIARVFGISRQRVEQIKTRLNR